jgi:hypothetical protein
MLIFQGKLCGSALLVFNIWISLIPITNAQAQMRPQKQMLPKSLITKQNSKNQNLKLA